jgi:hypothetical protein
MEISSSRNSAALIPASMKARNLPFCKGQIQVNNPSEYYFKFCLAYRQTLSLG